MVRICWNSKIWNTLKIFNVNLQRRIQTLRYGGEGVGGGGGRWSTRRLDKGKEKV